MKRKKKCAVDLTLDSDDLLRILGSSRFDAPNDDIESIDDSESEVVIIKKSKSTFIAPTVKEEKKTENKAPEALCYSQQICPSLALPLAVLPINDPRVSSNTIIPSSLRNEILRSQEGSPQIACNLSEFASFKGQVAVPSSLNNEALRSQEGSAEVSFDSPKRVLRTHIATQEVSRSV